MNIDSLNEKEVNILIETFKERPHANHSILNVLRRLQSENKLTEEQEWRVMHLLICFKLHSYEDCQLFPENHILQYDLKKDEYFIYDTLKNQTRSLTSL